MRADLLSTLTAASNEAQTLLGEPFTTPGGTTYTLTARQLTEAEDTGDGYGMTSHGHRDRQVWLLVGTRGQFPIDATTLRGTKLTRASTGQVVTLRTIDHTSDPLHLQLIAIT